MNSAKYIELFKNGQKEGIRDVTVKRKLQTVRKFLSYLEYSREIGFQRAFLWACPPTVGDEYIL